MYRKLEVKFYEQVLKTENEEAAQEMVDEIHEHASKLEKLTEYANHLKRAKYREVNNMSADDVVTDDMLAETTEADLFPQASQYADEDVDDIWPCDEDTTEGTGEETSQESGAPEE